MTINMIKGYVGPPSEGGAAYHEYSQFGYTFITQEGEGHSEPDEAAFQPVEHWNGYDEHPLINLRRPAGLSVPGPLGDCCGCSRGPNPGSMGDLPSGSTGLMALAAAAAAYFLLKKKARGSYGRAPKRRRSRR